MNSESCGAFCAPSMETKELGSEARRQERKHLKQTKIVDAGGKPERAICVQLYSFLFLHACLDGHECCADGHDAFNFPLVH